MSQDIFRAAKLVIDQQGEEAAIFAAGRANKLVPIANSMSSAW